ncbi:MAG TPA: hypothetical protein VGH80_12225 [Xanthomonadaceae bacterium]|jgi:hypothetical protein
MSSNLIPASELPPGTEVWVNDLSAEGRASFDSFLLKHAKHYRGHPTELDRWIRQGVLDEFAERINQGQTISYLLASEATKDGNEYLFHPSPADVLCEVLQRPE